VLANDMVVTSHTDAGEAMRLVGLPFKLSATPGLPGSAPPAPGQHNREVLANLGFNEAEIDDLDREGVL